MKKYITPEMESSDDDEEEEQAYQGNTRPSKVLNL